MFGTHHEGLIDATNANRVIRSISSAQQQHEAEIARLARTVETLRNDMDNRGRLQDDVRDLHNQLHQLKRQVADNGALLDEVPSHAASSASHHHQLAMTDRVEQLEILVSRHDDIFTNTRNGSTASDALSAIDVERAIARHDDMLERLREAYESKIDRVEVLRDLSVKADKENVAETQAHVQNKADVAYVEKTIHALERRLVNKIDKSRDADGDGRDDVVAWADAAAHDRRVLKQSQERILELEDYVARLVEDRETAQARAKQDRHELHRVAQALAAVQKQLEERDQVAGANDSAIRRLEQEVARTNGLVEAQQLLIQHAPAHPHEHEEERVPLSQRDLDGDGDVDGDDLALAVDSLDQRVRVADDTMQDMRRRLADVEEYAAKRDRITQRLQQEVTRANALLDGSEASRHGGGDGQDERIVQEALENTDRALDQVRDLTARTNRQHATVQDLSERCTGQEDELRSAQQSILRLQREMERTNALLDANCVVGGEGACDKGAEGDSTRVEELEARVQEVVETTRTQATLIGGFTFPELRDKLNDVLKVTFVSREEFDDHAAFINEELTRVHEDIEGGVQLLGDNIDELAGGALKRDRRRRGRRADDDFDDTARYGAAAARHRLKHRRRASKRRNSFSSSSSTSSSHVLGADVAGVDLRLEDAEDLQAVRRARGRTQRSRRRPATASHRRLARRGGARPASSRGPQFDLHGRRVR